MITDINGKSEIRVLNRATLPEYWGQYFLYERDNELYNLTKEEFLKEIESVKKTEKPFIDSQIVISNMLTKLGKRHSFHRQFNERFPNLHKEQVLGMQLYKIMVDDSDIWVYLETQHSGHLFSHATYFIKT